MGWAIVCKIVHVTCWQAAGAELPKEGMNFACIFMHVCTAEQHATAMW